MTRPALALLHYAGPPGIGGVEATIAAHAELLADDGYAVCIIAGSGSPPDPRATMIVEPLLGSRHPRIDAVNVELSQGQVSPAFHALVDEIAALLRAALAGCAVALVHNVHTLHKNLAFTAALARLHDAGEAPRLIAWAHDFAWHDPLYLPQLHPGWPWSLLRQPWPDVQYVAVSHDRRAALAELLQIPAATIAVVPPGVDVARLMKLESVTTTLLKEYNLLEADPLLVLPARLTRRKNIELALRIVAALRATTRAPQLVVTGPPGPHNPGNAAYVAELHALQAELDAPVHFLYAALRTAPSAAAGQPAAAHPVSDAMIADWFSLADGLLFPSRAEGFGMPVIEAALRGVPIFCADIAPFREIVGEHALRFALDELPASIAQRIARCLDQDPRYQLRRQTRTHYTWRAIYDRAIAPLLDPGL